ncbi:MAG: hypothetical protein HY927_14405 [Elusimicrobia bacterium]|nr:hypothetical protein [Elusimicrobiota bacterium]
MARILTAGAKISLCWDRALANAGDLTLAGIFFICTALAAVMVLWGMFMVGSAVKASRSAEPAPRGRAFKGAALIIVSSALVLLISIPTFVELIRRPSEGASKGNLGAIRSALSIYYGDMEGTYPTDLASLTIAGKYLYSIPEVHDLLPYHPDSSTIDDGETNATDSGGWHYNNVATDANFGSVLINCTHTDRKGSFWNAY